MSPAASPMTKWWVTPVAVLASSALAAAAILIFKPQVDAFRRRPAPAAASVVSWDVACGDDRASDFICFQKHYQAIIATANVADAFTDLKAAYEKSSFVKGHCHQLVHVIGRAAAEKFGDVARAYDQGDDFCWSGYYHGVMEAILAKIGYLNIRSQISTICKSMGEKERYSFFHYNCVHGLGHGVMLVHRNELFDALGTCDNLGDRWERESCYSGVFMENIMAGSNPDHATKYLKKDDLMYPCNAVKEQYKQQCYLMQTSHALQSNGYDFLAVFMLCDTVEGAFRATCFESLGRDASGHTVSDPVRTRDICMLGSNFDARNRCFAGAVKDFIGYTRSLERGQKLCNLLEPRLRDPCLATAEDFNQRMK